MAARYYMAQIQDALTPDNINAVGSNVFVQVDTVNDLDDAALENVNVVYSKEDYTAFRRLAAGIGKDKWETTGAISA